MITVKELANELGISVQAVYKMIKKEKYKNYILIKDGKKFIKKEILDELKPAKETAKDVKNGADQYELQAILLEQLQTKDKQIEQLTNRISELNTLILNNQLMLNSLQEQVKQLNAPPVEQEKSKRTWKDLFKKR